MGAADGFNLMPPMYPHGLEDFVDHVVPVLQQRGLFRRSYERPESAEGVPGGPMTLRELLGQ